MSEEADPILTFFTEVEAEQTDILYVTLGLTNDATADQLRKAYRLAALRCHPDKHVNKAKEEREMMTISFQKIGFAWAVLSDEKRRRRYDTTGRTDDVKFADAEEVGWEAYFEELFDRIDRKILDDDKAKYQGSNEELEDIISAYVEAKGSLPGILDRIPHSSVADEPRFITIVEGQITKGTLERTKKWSTTSTDKAAHAKRRKAAEKDAKAAEEAAKNLGVWDEFYGSGKKGDRQGDTGKENRKGKGKDGKGAEDDTDNSLAALIRRRQNQRAGILDALEEKYASKGKKRKAKAADAEEPHPAELDDDAFAALQAKMFGDKPKNGPSQKKRKAKV